MPQTEARETTSALSIAKSTLGVGIVGVSPVRGWATTAHIPALRALPNYEIRAFSAHDAESARAAGEAFGVSAVFVDHERLLTHPDIDVVAVTVKVPHHRELVSAALAAAKAVYCEWPLGRDLDDARAMAALAAEKGVRTAVGLQARQAPAIEFVQQLLRDGYVGEVLSTTMVGVSVTGDALVQPNAYMLDKTNGANLLTVPFGHSLDTLSYLLGEFAELSAVADVRRPLITIQQTGEQVVKTAPDQIAVIGTLTSGATASIHIREAVAGGTGFLWEINGTDGTLRITADPARHRSNLILGLLCAAQFMLILDIAIVNVALPSMQRTLGLSAENIQWVVGGYALTFGGFLMLGGRLADVVGRRRMFLTGLVLFIGASMLGGFSRSGGMLIAARVIQGFAGALVSPAALSLLTTTFKEGRERNRALGMWSAMAAGGASAGLILGGLLTQELSWRFTLLVNVPLGLAAVLLSPVLPAEASRRGAKVSLDIPGAVSLTGGILALAYGVTEATGQGFASPKVLIALALSAGLLIAFVVVEKRSSQPLLLGRMLRLRSVVAGNSVAALVSVVMIGAVFFNSLYLQEILG